MKRKSTLRKRFKLLSLLIITLVFLAPNDLFGSQNHHQDITIVVSCVEDIGNGKIRIHFGYENPNAYPVYVYRKWSKVYFNHGRSKEYVISGFQPGVVEKAFYKDIDSNDQAEWVLRLSWWKVIRVTGDINSDRCQGSYEDLDIIPGYIPPVDGKVLESKIGAELTSLHQAYIFDPANFAGASDAIFQLDGTKVLIEVVAETEQFDAMISSLAGVLFEIVTEDPGVNRATGWVEIADLLLLNEMLPLRYARPVYPGVSNYTIPVTGLTNSQGDFAMHSDFARLGFDIDGSGVKIGVLSNSFNSQNVAALDVSNGDLPGADNPNGYSSEVEVIKDITDSYGALSDEGRAMLQIVHDIAPGAELAFRTGYLGEQDMADGIRELADAGSDIIVDDLSYITEPFFRDGVISQTIDSVVSEGITFFSSAGNFGKSSYAGVFDSEPAPSSITGTAHDFSGAGDIFQAVLLKEGNYTLVLQWDDGSDPDMTTTTTDLDVFLSDDAGSALLGFNRENIGGFPIEVVPFSIVGDSVYSNIVIARASGPDVPVKFKYILFRGGSQFEMLEYGGGSSTIVGHPNAAGAISVGAVRFDKNPVYSPGVYTEPVIMSFSSVGGTPVNDVVRNKPDITAPNGVNTTVDLGNGDWDDPIDPDTRYPNFFGTSAASPHAAGVAALIMEAKLKFDSASIVSPDEIRTLMKTTALDMDVPGEDHVSGSGFIQAHKALMTFANPTPYVENLILATDSLALGDEIMPFTFTVTGDFFTDSTRVLFRGETLEEGVVIQDENTIIVEHPGFLGNPEIQAYNPVISSSELDGGLSEGIFFSDPVKQTIIIAANNASKKYGELVPENTASIMLITAAEDTLNLADAVLNGFVLQEEEDRLSGLSYAVAALTSSDAGDYLIVPSLSPELDMDNPLTEIDYAISEKYILEFVNASLAIEKLALTITPQDMDMVYGEELPAEGINFLYEIGDSGVVIEDPGLVLSGVQQEHLAALTNEIALVRGVAMVNGIPVVRGVALVNGARLIRGTALVNGVEVKVAVEGTDTTVYVAGEALVNGGTLIRGIALVNGRPFVNMPEIVRGIALVNGNEVTFDDGYMTELNGIALVNKVPAVRGVALVNELGGRGIALVNGLEVAVENGITTIDGLAVPTNGIALVNGIPVVRGTALVNSSMISRGLALVNGLEVPIENGIPTLRGTALVNGVPTVRGIALVNGVPLFRGTALVNNLEVNVDDGEVTQVYENGVLVNGLNMSKGIALVNGVALVNGAFLGRGVALVNGIALVNEAGSGDDVVNLENINFMASGTALVNGSVPSVRGIALVNGIDGVDGDALKIAAGTVQPDSSIIYEDVSVSNGIALVNGFAYVRGTALVNGSSPTKGTALVNGSGADANNNSGTILVFDATDIGDSAQNVSFTPISFITGTTAGQHWIVPGTFLSNNFEISYGLGKLSIEQADLSITAEDQVKTYGDADPPLTYADAGLLADDTLSGELIREKGEETGDYHILQGSLTAGDNYAISFDSATFSIKQRELVIGITAEDKVYDGTLAASTSPHVLSGLVEGDSLVVSSLNGLFETEDVGSGKAVTADVFTSGTDAFNYIANTEASDTASITRKGISLGITANDKVYDGNTDAATTAFIKNGLVEGDTVTVSSAGGFFDTKDVGTVKLVTALVSTAGTHAGNYMANASADTTAAISSKGLVIGLSAENKVYDGTPDASTSAFVSSGLLEGDDVSVSSVSGVFEDKHVGTGKQVTAVVSTAGADAGNYLANADAETIADISSRALVIGLSAENKVYDGTPDASTGAFVSSGLLEGDDVSVSSANGVFEDKHVGTGKQVTAVVSTAGADAGNYLANADAETIADISARALVIGLSAEHKVYDGTPDALTSAYVSSGLVEGDDVSVSSASGVFQDKHVGIAKQVTAEVSAFGTDAGNYLANAGAETIADISTRALVIGLSAENKVYDGSSDASTGAFVSSGLLEGDDVSVSSGSGAFQDKHVGIGKQVTAEVSAFGADAGNYLTNAGAETIADISARALVIGLSAENKVYDGSSDASTSAFVSSGLVEGDDVSVSSASGTFQDKHVGTGKRVTAEVSAFGTDAGNYLANAGAETIADISSRALLAGLSAENKIYDGTTFASTVVYIESGLLAGDEVTVSSAGGMFDTKDAGTYKVVSAAVSASGADANNYLINASAATMADIAQKEVFVSPVNRIFYIHERDLLPQNVFQYDGWIEGDEGNEEYTALRYYDWMPYDPDSYQAAGLYFVSPTPSNSNYTFHIVKGWLWVLNHESHDSYQKSASISGDIEEESLVSDELLAYPNPVVDKVHLSMKEIENYKMIQLYDFAGRTFPITSIDKRTDHLEIDMAQLSAGHYFIRIVMEDSSRVVQIIKQ